MKNRTISVWVSLVVLAAAPSCGLFDSAPAVSMRPTPVREAFDTELTPAGKKLAEQRLTAFRETMRRTVKTKEEMIQAGWDKEIDGIEQGPSQWVQPSMGVATRMSAGDEAAAGENVLLRDSIVLDLAGRLGREPSQEEVTRAME